MAKGQMKDIKKRDARRREFDDLPVHSKQGRKRPGSLNK